MQQVVLGNKVVGSSTPTLIVAEIGNNHDGSMGQARSLIDAALECRVDAVNFQTHITDEEMLPHSPKPSHFPEPRYQFVRRMEWSEEQHRELKAYGEAKGLLFYSTPIALATGLSSQL